MAKKGEPRPVYTEWHKDEVIRRISQGESLRDIAKSEGMPSTTAILRWLAEDEDYHRQYVRAREAQADVLADEIVSIADGTHLAEGEKYDANKARLQVDARKWVAAKLKPNSYGDKLTADINVTQRKSDAELIEEAKRLAGALGMVIPSILQAPEAGKDGDG